MEWLQIILAVFLRVLLSLDAAYDWSLTLATLYGSFHFGKNSLNLENIY